MSDVPVSPDRRRLLQAGALLVGAGAIAGCAGVRRPVGTASGRFVRRELLHAGARTAYQVFVPAADAPRPLPVVLFLHGSGERGDDGARQTTAGLGPYLRSRGHDLPALVVFPQSPEGRSWEDGVADMAMAVLGAATSEFEGDPRRTSLTGMSRGGYGTWSLALRAPDRFAALVPVCGGITPPGTRPGLERLEVSAVRAADDPFADAARRLRHIPGWIFHGARDDVIPPQQSRRMYAALRDAGADVRYSEFPDADHNSWDSAYAMPALWDWLLAQRR